MSAKKNISSAPSSPRRHCGVSNQPPPRTRSTTAAADSTPSCSCATAFASRATNITAVVVAFMLRTIGSESGLLVQPRAPRFVEIFDPRAHDLVERRAAVALALAERLPHEVEERSAHRRLVVR